MGEYQKNEQYSQEEVLKLVTFYHTALEVGDGEGVKEASARIFKFIEKYVNKTLWETCGTIMRNPMYCDDLKQDVWLHIFEELKKYNPDKGTLTTFVKYWILHAVSNFSSRSFHNTTTYYATVIQKINRAKNFCKQAGMDSDDMDVLIRLTGLTDTTIRHALTYMERQNKTSYEALVDAGVDYVSGVKSPEVSLMEAETLRELTDVCSEILTEEEIAYFLILITPGADGKTHASYREIQAQFPRTNIPYIKKTISRLLVKLRSSSRIIQLFPQIARMEKALEDIFIPVFDNDDEEETDEMYANFIRDMDVPDRDEPQVRKVGRPRKRQADSGNGDGQDKQD